MNQISECIARQGGGEHLAIELARRELTRIIRDCARQTCILLCVRLVRWRIIGTVTRAIICTYTVWKIDEM